MSKKNVYAVISGMCLLLQAASAGAAGPEARFKSKDPVVRMDAAREAGNLKSTAAVQGLILLLKDKSQGVAAAAAVSLGQIRDPRAVDPLIAAAEKSSFTAVRVMAAQSLGYFPGDKALGALGRAAEDESPAVRGAACRSLGRFGGQKEADKLILKASSDPEGEVRRTAVETLADMAELKDMGDKKTAIETALTGAAADKEEKNRRAAAKALKRLKREK